MISKRNWAKSTLWSVCELSCVEHPEPESIGCFVPQNPQREDPVRHSRVGTEGSTAAGPTPPSYLIDHGLRWPLCPFMLKDWTVWLILLKQLLLLFFKRGILVSSKWSFAAVNNWPVSWAWSRTKVFVGPGLRKLKLHTFNWTHTCWQTPPTHILFDGFKAVSLYLSQTLWL